MHPRNPYAKWTDFKRYLPHIEEFFHDGTIDYKNPVALQSLVKAQFLVDFGLKIDLGDLDSLCPRLPNRLNYIYLKFGW